MFYHAACFSPSKITFIQTMRRNDFTSRHGLTTELVAKYLPKTEATVKGHTKKKIKGTNSTQPKQIQPQAPPKVIKQRTNQVF